MSKKNTNRVHETIIPQDLSYLPGGDDEPSDGTTSRKQRWLRFLLWNLAAMFIAPVLKLVPLAIVAGGIAWVYSPTMFDSWQIPFNFSSNLDPNTWIESARQWSESHLSDFKNLMTTEAFPQQVMPEENLSSGQPNPKFPTALLSTEPLQ